MQRDLVLRRELAVRDWQRLRQLPRRRVQEVQGQGTGVDGGEDRRRGQSRELPHAEQRSHVDVAFLVRVVAAAQRSELVEVVDVAVVHARPPDELLTRHRHVNSSSRPAHDPRLFPPRDDGSGVLRLNRTVSRPSRP